jgi:ankyrin repeat protein
MINHLNRSTLFAVLAFALSAPSWGVGTPEEDFIASIERKDLVEAQRIFADHPNLNADFRIMEGQYAGANLLTLAAVCKLWDIVRMILQSNPHANVDAALVEGEPRGATALWFAARWQQWDIVQMILQSNPHANVDAALVEGKGRDITALWFATNDMQWDIVRLILQSNPRARVDAVLPEGSSRGISALWFAAKNCQWDIVRIMLQNNPHANVDAASADGKAAGETVLWLAARFQQWDLVRTILQNNPGANLSSSPVRSQLAVRTVEDLILQDAPDSLLTLMLIQGLDRGDDLSNPYAHPRFQNLYNELCRIFRRAAMAFIDLGELASVYETSSFDDLPRELRRDIALRLLRKENPDLKNIPDSMLERVLVHFQCVYKPIERDGRIPDVVACQVLERLCPMASRDHRSLADCENERERKRLANKKKDLINKRKWIREEVDAAIQAKLLPSNLNEEMRERVAAILSEKPISSMTRKWVREQLKNFHFPEPEAEAPVRAKRERPEAGEDETARQLRARLTLEVIAGAPILNRAEIEARVDEMMEAPEPMEIDIIAPANNNANFFKEGSKQL